MRGCTPTRATREEIQHAACWRSDCTRSRVADRPSLPAGLMLGLPALAAGALEAVTLRGAKGETDPGVPPC
jgi:hypothetical protein